MRLRIRWLTVGVLLLAAGCGGASRTSNDLKILGIAYHGFCDAMNRGPANEKELEPYYERDQRLSEALRSGQYVFLWGVSMRDLIAGAGPAATVLAYEKDVPTKGGYVLMGDASVRKMTAQEFQSAPKAKAKENEKEKEAEKE